MTNLNDIDLVAELYEWHDEMSAEVRLVFDHNDSFERIVTLAGAGGSRGDQSSAVAAEQLGYSQRLATLAANLNQMDARVSDWQGQSRAAFDKTVAMLSSRISSLAEIGEHSSQLLGTASVGQQAADRLFAELVRTSIDYAERSLQMARAMVLPTAGASMSNWTAANLKQVAQLLDQLADARRHTSALLDQVSYLVNQLASTATELTDELAGMETALRS